MDSQLGAISWVAFHFPSHQTHFTSPFPMLRVLPVVLPGVLSTVYPEICHPELWLFCFGSAPIVSYPARLLLSLNNRSYFGASVRVSRHSYYSVARCPASLTTVGFGVSCGFPILGGFALSLSSYPRPLQSCIHSQR